MTPTANKPTRRPRQKVESYDAWLAKLDKQVEGVARKMVASRRDSEKDEALRQIIESLPRALALASKRGNGHETARAQIAFLCLLAFTYLGDEDRQKEVKDMVLGKDWRP